MSNLTTHDVTWYLTAGLMGRLQGYTPLHVLLHKIPPYDVKDRVVWRERLEAAVKTLMTYHADVNATDAKVGLQAYQP